MRVALLLAVGALVLLSAFAMLMSGVATSASAPVSRRDTVPQSFLIVFVRGSGSTWLQALLNEIVVAGANPFLALNEPEHDVLWQLHVDPRSVSPNASFVGAKSKIGQLNGDMRLLIANGSFRGRVVFLHRLDAFAHVVGVCRKKLSPNQNAVAFDARSLTRNGTEIDEKLFEVQARELDEQRDQLRSLAAMRDIAGLETLHLGYESFMQKPLDSLRRLVSFLTRGSTPIADDALRRALDSTRLPLKNTRSVDATVVPNVVALARVASQFAFLRPWISPTLAALVENVESQEKAETIKHKADREAFYDARNVEERDEFFEACLSPPVPKNPKKAPRPQLHCRVIDFLSGPQPYASSRELGDYFERGGLRFPNVAACVHFAASLSMVTRFNVTAQRWDLKEHLRMFKGG
jgi:hypothetical protein